MLMAVPGLGLSFAVPGEPDPAGTREDKEVTSPQLLVVNGLRTSKHIALGSINS